MTTNNDTDRSLLTISILFVARGDIVLTDGPFTVADFADATRPGVRLIDTDGRTHHFTGQRVTVLR